MSINLNITADTAGQMRDILAELLGDRIPVMATAPTAAEQTGTFTEAEPNPTPEAPKPGRGRPRKTAAEAPVEDAKVVDEPAAQATVETVTVTFDDVRAAMAALIQKGSEGARASVEICRQLEAFDAEKLPKLAAVKPEQYADCIRLANEAIARLEAASAAGVM